MLPQPPPDAPSPSLSEATERSRRLRRDIWMAGLISIVSLVLLGLFGLVTPWRTRSHKNVVQAEAINNARQIGLALFDFEAEYGKFPDVTTIAEIQRKSGTPLSLGTKTSNDFFRQLMASKIVESEAIFYTKHRLTRKPDGLIDGSRALAKGECGFSYFLGASSVSNPARPLVVAPMIPGTDRFDPKPYKGKAVVLKLDNSVTSLPINNYGHVILDGRNLMDPNHPIWEGNPPTIAWPDL